MALISVKGFFDTHVHTGPAPFQRLGDTIDIARWCAEAGMTGFVVKSHFEATISKAYHTRKEFPNLALIPGIALNRGVGGINPGAVEQALSQGAQIVWFPTLDARNHVQFFGASGNFGNIGAGSYARENSNRPRGNFTVWQDGKLSEDAKEVIDLVVSYGAVLATGHIEPKEILAVVDYALGKKHPKIVITHPEMYVPHLDLKTQVELAKAGCFMEYCAVNCMPMFHCVLPEQLKEMIDAVTPERAILATDSGQPFSPKTPELFRIFVQMLYERGVKEKAIAQMAIKNPTTLFGITPLADSVHFLDRIS